MHKVPRRLNLGLLLAVGGAYTGDDVTITSASPLDPAIRSVSVNTIQAVIGRRDLPRNMMRKVAKKKKNQPPGRKSPRF